MVDYINTLTQYEVGQVFQPAWSWSSASSGTRATAGVPPLGGSQAAGAGEAERRPPATAGSWSSASSRPSRAAGVSRSLRRTPIAEFIRSQATRRSHLEAPAETAFLRRTLGATVSCTRENSRDARKNGRDARGIGPGCAIQRDACAARSILHKSEWLRGLLRGRQRIPGKSI